MKGQVVALGFALAVAGCCLAQTSSGTSAPKTIALKCGNLFDGRGDSLRKDVVIVKGGVVYKRP